MSLKNFMNKLEPHFEAGKPLHPLQSFFDGMSTFLYVPHATSRSGASIHDAIDSKRIMSLVVVALLPALLFGMYNVGYQNYAAAGALPEAGFWELFGFGFLAVLPNIVVSYVVGLGIEFAWAQWKHEEIHEGFLVSGILIPMIVPVTIPLWMLALATAFAVVFAKEIFGGTGMNIFNVAVATRMFLFFSYPSSMTGDRVWVSKESIFGLGNDLPDALTAATPLGQIWQGPLDPATLMDSVTGLIPGSVGETSVIAIALGAALLLWTGVASWKTMLSVFVGGGATAALFSALGMSQIAWWHHLVLGGFCFGAVFMATDPVTSARTEAGKWVFGLLVGAMAIVVRVMNPGYPEGMMLAIFFGNMAAPLIDWCVVQANINKRMKRATHKQ